jgi:oligoendopeptidase F
VTEGFHVSHRFYSAKAKMLGQKTLRYFDRNASIGKTKRKFSFEEAVSIVTKAFDKFNPIYGDIFRKFVANGQLDAYPELGKTGGAYCSGRHGIPTYVLLNHNNDLNSVLTLAHEMGHAIHTELSQKNQSPLYRSYTTVTAETASTLFENFVFDEILPYLSEKEKVIALHDQSLNHIQSIHRQIACFNFEMDLHKGVREKGSLAKGEIAALMNKHMSAYLGPKFKMTDVDGYFFVTWSHIRRFFYVYSYAFGQLVSSALYAMYRENPKFESKIRQFLSAGGSASPEDIFKNIGIDVRNPQFFKKGLEKIEEDVKRLEILIK